MAQTAQIDASSNRTPRRSSTKSSAKAEAVWESSFSRDEMNLAEFPLAVLSTRVNPNVKTLEFSDTSRAPNGEMMERKWIITGADKFGLPTSTDDDVVLGLMRLSMAHGFRERKVYFTRYELLKTLRWSTEGRSYQRLIKSLDRLSGVRIRSSNSFYDNQSKSYQTLNFGLIDSYEINDCRRGPGEEELKSFFVWSEQLFESFKAGYIKKLDLDLYFSLRSAVSRRLYRYLDKHFYYKTVIERQLLPFAFEKIGLSRSYKYVSSIKQQLEPALEELTTIGFLQGYEVRGRGAAATIRFIAARGGASVAASATPQDSATGALAGGGAKGIAALDASAGASLAEKLIQRGMAAPQARRLTGQIPRSKHERIEKIIAYYDQLVAQNDYKVSKNRVGFLYRAVERSDEFSLPEEQIAPGNRSKRPELQIFRAEKRPNAETSARRAQAQGAVKGKESRPKRGASPQGEKNTTADPQTLARAMAQFSAEELQQIYQQVEEKMRCFKSVLGAQHYQEAIDGCVREEVLKRMSQEAPK